MTADTPKPALPDLLRSLEDAAMDYQDDPAEYTDRRLNDARERVLAAIDAAVAEARAVLPCGHPASLMLRSAETGAPLYCELCDAQSGRRDAEAMEAELRKQLAEARAVPEGWKLLKDTTHAERSWPEDSSHENGNYSNTCVHCLRGFVGHKRRPSCKMCAATPSPAEQPATDKESLTVETVPWPQVTCYSGGASHEGIGGRVWIRLADDGPEIEYVPAEQPKPAVREALAKVVSTYDAYRRRGVSPAPAEYADVVAAIEAARAALQGEPHDRP